MDNNTTQVQIRVSARTIKQQSDENNVFSTNFNVVKCNIYPSVLHLVFFNITHCLFYKILGGTLYTLHLPAPCHNSASGLVFVPRNTTITVDAI